MDDLPRTKAPEGIVDRAEGSHDHPGNDEQDVYGDIAMKSLILIRVQN